MVNVFGLLSSQMRKVVARPATAFVTRGRSERYSLSHVNARVLSGTSLDRGSLYEGRALSRLYSSVADDDEKTPSPRKKKQTGKKIKVKEITPEKLELLAAAFDEMARKEGFHSSSAIHTDGASFEDDFEDDEFLDDDDDFLDNDDQGDDDSNVLDSKSDEWNSDAVFDSRNFNLDDFDEAKVNEKNKKQTTSEFNIEDDDDVDDFLDFGGNEDDMDARIARAQRDLSMGRVSVPDELDAYATRANLAELGFKREVNPFGDDETPRKAAFTLITNAMTCSGCGSDFQCRDEHRPGYLPAEKFEVQTKLAKLEELQILKSKAEAAEWTPEDEVEYLIQTSGGGSSELGAAAEFDVDAMAEKMGLDLVELGRKKVICKRCHGLQNFGEVEKGLRPGWTDEPTMSQQQFRDLLKPISEKPAVIIALVDLFDFSGSVLRELDGIAGENPVILAANKVDLLPPKMGKQRAENWVRRELEYMGVKSLANVGGAVRLISCKTGAGVKGMLEKARELADEIDGDVYVVGAANAGKSTLVNCVLGRNDDKPVGKIRAGNRNALKGALTTSPLPGTTLKFIKIDIGDGKSMYDTPGLLVPGTFTQLLTPEELKIVCPKK